MTLLDAFFLGALQGLTEFLPISSSGHLVLAETWLKLPVENLKSFDIAVHFGTLLAIVVYFWKDVANLWRAFWQIIFGVFKKKSARADHQNIKTSSLLSQLILATIPAIIFGLLFSDWLDEKFRHPFSVAILMMIVGVLFFVAEFIASKLQKKSITFRQAMIMGFAQCLALIPGVSRSGITISAGLVQGVKRDEAAKFSFLLGGMTIIAATAYAIFEIIKQKYTLPPTDILIVGIASSFLFGLVAISFLMRFLKNHTLHIFGAYRVILGLVLLYFLFLP